MAKKKGAAKKNAKQKDNKKGVEIKDVINPIPNISVACEFHNISHFLGRNLLDKFVNAKLPLAVYSSKVARSFRCTFAARLNSTTTTNLEARSTQIDSPMDPARSEKWFIEGYEYVLGEMLDGMARKGEYEMTRAALMRMCEAEEALLKVNLKDDDPEDDIEDTVTVYDHHVRLIHTLRKDSKNLEMWLIWECRERKLGPKSAHRPDRPLPEIPFGIDVKSSYATHLKQVVNDARLKQLVQKYWPSMSQDLLALSSSGIYNVCIAFNPLLSLPFTHRTVEFGDIDLLGYEYYFASAFDILKSSIKLDVGDKTHVKDLSDPYFHLTFHHDFLDSPTDSQNMDSFKGRLYLTVTLESVEKDPARRNGWAYSKRPTFRGDSELCYISNEDRVLVYEAVCPPTNTNTDTNSNTATPEKV